MNLAHPTRRTFVVLLAAAVLLIGCGPQIQFLKVSPELTFKGLKEGKLAVLPVSSPDPKMDHQALARMGAELMDAIRHERRGLELAPVEAVRKALEKPEARDAVKAFAEGKEIPPAVQGSLSKDLGAKYLIFGRIDGFDGTTLRGSLTIFDATTGQPCWEGKHQVAGTAGGKAGSPPPAELSTKLFNELIDNLPPVPPEGA